MNFIFLLLVLSIILGLAFIEANNDVKLKGLNGIITKVSISLFSLLFILYIEFKYSIAISKKQKYKSKNLLPVLALGRMAWAMIGLFISVPTSYLELLSINYNPTRTTLIVISSIYLIIQSIQLQIKINNE